LARDAQGNVYIGDNGGLFKLTADFATVQNLIFLDGVSGVAVLANGTILLARSYRGTVCRYDNSTSCTVVAGMEFDYAFSGNGGPATSAMLNMPNSVTAHPSDPQKFYIADTHNNMIRMVSNGVITTVAGNGTDGFGGDGGPATSAMLALPKNVAVDAAGNLFIADTDNNRIRWGCRGTCLPLSTLLRVGPRTA
jgi:hypothetical protein